MTMEFGFKSQLLLDHEKAYKTAPDSIVGMSMPFKSFSLKGTQELIQNDIIRGNRFQYSPDLGNLAVSGSAVVPLDVLGFGYWLKGMFGAPTTTGAGPYVHTFKPTVAGQTSMILEKKFGTLAKYIKNMGVKVASMALDFDHGTPGAIFANLNLEAATEDVSDTSYDATPTTFTITPFRMDQASLTEGGSSFATATKVSLNVDFDLDTGIYCIGSEGKRSELPDGVLAVSGTLTTLFDSWTTLNKALASTESSLVITLTSGTNTLVFTIGELQYERNISPIEGPKGIMLDLPFKAYYANGSDAAPIKVVLTNSQATY